MLLHLNDWQVIANMYSLHSKISVSTLCKLCTTTKVDTYFGTETAKEKTIHAVPSPLNRKP